MTSKKYDCLSKILLIGDSGVGKSSIMLRYTDDEYSNSFISTVGIDFRIKYVDVNNQRIKLQIWDTGGQEKFRTITTVYYRNATGIIMVYDISNRESFLNMKTWLSDIERVADKNVKKILVGNKCDINDTLRVVSTQEGKKFANSIGIDFIETSAYANKNINEIFTLLLDKFKETSTDDQKIENVKINSVNNNKNKCSSCAQ